MSSLAVPFALRGLPGVVDVVVSRSSGSGESGLDVVDPHLSAEDGVGLPICTATIHFSGRGYAAAMGWVQVVRCEADEVGADFEPDPLALFREANMPYGYFGIKPTLYDAPYRRLDRDLRWTARSYLAVSEHAVMGRTVTPIAAFTWGFEITGGRVVLAEPIELPIGTWAAHRTLLTNTYPGWRF